MKAERIDEINYYQPCSISAEVRIEELKPFKISKQIQNKIHPMIHILCSSNQI